MTQTLRELNEARLDVFRMFSAAGKVLVVCDPTSFGVRVPDWLRKEYGRELTLRFGYRNGGLSVDAQGISETLSFKGVPHRVSIPWAAISAMVAEDGRAWVATSGPEAQEPAQPAAELPPARPPQARPALRLVPDPDAEPQ